MKIYPEKLGAALQKGLAPVYLLAGDEVLLREESADAIRAAARAAGYSEREVYFAEKNFDWNQLAMASASLSLFAEKRLIELRLPTGKPGTQGAAAMQEYAKNPPEDTILLVSSAKPERTPAWVKALESAGVHVPCWPLPPERLPKWIESRLRSRSLQPDNEAVQLLAQRVEGNLLAAAQEIDKLALLVSPKEPLTAQVVATAVADSARYDVYKCVDAALAGQPNRARRMADGLRAEGSPTALLLWALARDLRVLVQIAGNKAQGMAESQAMASVWNQRRPLFSRALARHNLGQVRRFLLSAARIDRVIKGAPGNAWDDITSLLVRMAGKPAGSGNP